MESVSTSLLAQSPASGLLQRQGSKLEALKNQFDHALKNGPKSGFELNGSKSPAEKKEELMEVAKKFESLLIHQMLKEMRKTIQKSELLNSFSLQQYESMLDEEIANTMAEDRGIGLADMLFYQLSRLEDAADPTASNKMPEN
ncbi:MAG: rod-binding protein [Nitrospinota bacterium]|nr:rod-binding protein [Nitrospinota bacterium]